MNDNMATEEHTSITYDSFGEVGLILQFPACELNPNIRCMWSMVVA